jgi:hypothetical protein
MSECAVGLDGTLKDASEIEWFNDIDDDQPTKDPSTAVSSVLLAPPTTMHPFFTGASPPALLVAGAHHSTCVSRPSVRVLDPDNVATSSSTTMKHKAAGNPHGTR